MLPIPPDMLAAIATLYGVGAAGAALLQARQIVRRRSSCEVSARFFATYAGGYAVWLLYGLMVELRHSGWHGRRFALLNLPGIVLVLGSMLALQVFPGATRHTGDYGATVTEVRP